MRVALVSIKALKKTVAITGRFLDTLTKVTKPILRLTINWLILRPYRLLIKLGRRVKNLWLKLPNLNFLSHHQSILYLLLVFALLVTANNWRIHQASAENFGQNNLIFPLIKPDFELLIIESGAGLIAESTETEVDEETSAITPEKQIEPSGIGAALLKPHLVTSAPGTAARTTIEFYTVEAGDTISSIAERFGLNINTLLWENKLTARSLIRPGQKLTILPTDGVTYRIGRGDTINSIAKKYNVLPENIINYNNISSSSLTIGRTIIIPGGKPPAPPAPVRVTKPIPSLPAISVPTSGNTRLLWPTDTRRITQYYTWRHGGVDIAGPTGTPIYAADEGIVEIAGWNNGGYGYYIVIDHGGGIKTLYAHASKLHVSAGDRVDKSQHIANIGSTGRSTGPHLHFEVRIRGSRTNPLNYIR